MKQLGLALNDAIENNSVHSFIMNTGHTLAELAGAYETVNFSTVNLGFAAFKWSQVRLFKTLLNVRVKLHTRESVSGSVKYDQINYNFDSVEAYQAAMPDIEALVLGRNSFTQWLGLIDEDGSMRLPGLSIKHSKNRKGTILFVVRKMVSGDLITKTFVCGQYVSTSKIYKEALDFYISISPYTKAPKEWLIVPKDRINEALHDSFVD